MKAIADTGFIVAFGSQGDYHHAWAVDIAKNITEPLITCEAVLAEAAFHLGSSSYVLSLLRNDMFRLGFDLTRTWSSCRTGQAIADRRPDLADLCVIRMSELYPRYTVITVDENEFRVFRRNKRETIPILCPPRA